MSPRVLKLRASRTSRRGAGKGGLAKNDYMASGSCYANKLIKNERSVEHV